MLNQTVAHELSKAGFEATEFNGKVLVSLKNRSVSTLEVSIALNQIFGEIEFITRKFNSNTVAVSA